MSDQEQSATDLIIASKAEMEYYRVVRTTLHGLDSVRLNASVSGLTICSAFIGVAFTSWKYAGSETLLGYMFSLAHLISALACLVAVISAREFIRKITLFSNFISESVKIAHEFESKIVRRDHLKITKQFDKHTHAGSKGDPLFKQSLHVLEIIAVIGCFSSFWFFFTSIQLIKTP